MAAIKTQVWIYNCDSCRKEVHPSQVYASQEKKIWTDGRDVSIYAQVADRINPPPPGITRDANRHLRDATRAAKEE